MPVRSEGTYQVPCYLWYRRNDFNDNYTRWCRSAKFIWCVTNDYTNLLSVENSWQILWCVTKVWCIFWKCCFSVMECNVLHYVPSVMFEWLLNCLLCDERQVKVTYTAYQLYSLIHAFFELFFFHFFFFLSNFVLEWKNV